MVFKAMVFVTCLFIFNSDITNKTVVILTKGVMGENT